MASLREYYEIDFLSTFAFESKLIIEIPNQIKQHIDVNYFYEVKSRSKYIALFVPESLAFKSVLVPAMRLTLNGFHTPRRVRIQKFGHDAIVGFKVEFQDRGGQMPLVTVSVPGDIDKLNFDDFTFTNTIYTYIDKRMDKDFVGEIKTLLKECSVIIRDTEYAKARSKLETPRAFISHDSRDKEKIARRIAERLRGMHCPVWYDEFSLRVGDSLRESIEKGLKECHRCIIILTPNFLGKGGWAKREYDMIFTRELVEEKKLILPIWSGVSRNEVFDYSPILVDRAAAVLMQDYEGNISEDMLEEICKKLINALN